MSRFLLRFLFLALLCGAAAGAQNGDVRGKRPGIVPDGPLARTVHYRKMHVFIVAVSRYRNLPRGNWLPGLDQEGLRFRSLMIRSYGAQPEDVKVLLNEDATRDHIRAGLIALTSPARVQPDDGVVVLFTMHGQTAGRDEAESGYLLPYDAPAAALQGGDDPSDFLDKCLEMSEVWRLLEKCRSRHVLILADACVSAYLLGKGPDRAGLAPVLAPEQVAQQFALGSFQGMVAGGKDETTYVSNRGSLFASAVMERMQARATSSGQVLLASELYGHVLPVVIDRAARYGKTQNPQLRNRVDRPGQFVFITTPEQPVPPYRPPGPALMPTVPPPAPDPERSFPPVPPRRPADLSLPGRANIEFVNVSAGEFTMGSNTGDSDEKPVRRVRITRGFQLGKYEVTNGQYAMFLASPEGKHHTPAGWDPGWATDPEKRDLPVGGVNWADANAFCGWAGCRLPSEAEWEYACRGPESREYPWAASKGGPSPTLAIFNQRGPARVGSCPEGVSWCGAEDMAGNLWEWCQDWYGAYDPKALVDPQGPATGQSRVLRGGSFGRGATFLRGAYRFDFLGYLLLARCADFGFRVAR